MITEPITVQLITTTNCQKCIAANRAVTAIVDKVRGQFQVDVQEINLVDHPQLAAQYGFWMTPALIVNGKLVGAGRITERMVHEKLVAAYPGDS